MGRERWSAAVMAAALLAGLPLLGWAQQPQLKQQRPPMERLPGTAPALKLEAVPIKVEAAGLTVTPAQPRVGQPATVKVTIKNAGAGTVPAVPWTLRNVTDNNALLGESTLGRLGPGQSAERAVEFTPGHAGTVKLRLQVALTGNTATATARELDVTVLPDEVVRELDYAKAEAAGAGFDNNRQSAPSTCQFGQQRSTYGVGDRVTTTVTFVALCQRQFVGVSGDPEAFKNFQLKNGWRILRVSESISKTSRSGADWVAKPTPGSTSPYMKVHLWADAGNDVTMSVTVSIIGPSTMDPYR